MKQIKRIVALMLAMMMVMGVSVTAFAEDTDGKTPTLTVPKEGDTGTIIVNDVESGATVKAYQYVEADYNNSGLYGYSLVAGAEGLSENFDITKSPDDKDIITLTNLATSNKLGNGVELAEQSDGSYKNTAAMAGTYIVLVTGNKATIYNPMVVSLFYQAAGGSGSSNNLEEDGVVSASGKYYALGTTEVYAKSQNPKVSKKVVSVTYTKGTGEEEEVVTDTKSGTKLDAAVGDVVTYEISTTIPDYSGRYTANDTFKFVLEDTLPAGLTYNSGVKVKIDGNDVQNVEDNISFNDNTLKIDLSKVALNYVGKQVTVTYSATLTNEAAETTQTDVSANTNTVKLTYSTSPNSGDTGSTEDTANVYTYKLETKDAAGNGIITKTDGNGNKLSGAVFTLTSEDKSHVYTSNETTENGVVTFEGLDAGIYTLKETVAPNEYSLNDTTYYVQVVPEYADDGKTVKNVSFKFATSEEGLNAEDVQTYLEFVDTKLTELPATGGIGTTIFTIAGIILMAGAAAVYFARRRRA